MNPGATVQGSHELPTQRVTTMEGTAGGSAAKPTRAYLAKAAALWTDMGESHPFWLGSVMRDPEGEGSLDVDGEIFGAPAVQSKVC